jgi:4-hydroxythreonine-4-phosphate dehydrogenase
MEAANRLVGSTATTRLAGTPEEAAGRPGTVDVLDSNGLDFQGLNQGRVSAAAGKASVEWVLQAGELALAGRVKAIVTAPINKEACSLAGYQDIGHMELYQRQAGADNVATMLMAGVLRVVHLTTHRALRRACDFVTRENVAAKLRLIDESFRRWGFASPRIGVAALNPHASDGGLIGDEEELHIAPAVQDVRAEGVAAQGPIPADTIFNQAIDGAHDVVLAMYHDQGHIAIKVHDWKKSVGVNLGLPFVRTSVDHGTAFDIAGKGVADHQSMLEALRVAVDLAADGRLR